MLTANQVLAKPGIYDTHSNLLPDALGACYTALIKPYIVF